MNGLTSDSEVKYQPPKNWKDLTVEEKLERLRQQVKFVQSQTNHALNETQNVKNNLNNHDHLNGKVVKDIKTINNLSMGLIGTSTLADSSAEVEGNAYF